MSDDTTTPTPNPDTDPHDPIRPAHYRDATGRDRIAVWSATLGPDEFLAAIGATVDRYLSRAGRKPGVSAEQDRAKAAEVARRFFEEWGEGADELLGDFLGDLGHDREAIDDLLLDAARPRTPTPPAEVTPQQAAGARPLPTREQQDVREAQQWHTGVAGLEVTPIVRDGDLTAEGRALLGMPTAPQANPLAGVTPLPPGGGGWGGIDEDNDIDLGDFVRFICMGDFVGIFAYVAQQSPALIEEYGWQQPPAAQDDQAAALQRERERADRAERALRIERGAPLPGDLPEGWTKRVTSELWWYAHPHADYDDAFDAEARRNLSGRWEWWATDDGHGGHRTTAAEAIDAAHAALTAQRSDDTARDDGSDSSASGEGDSALPPDGYDWHDGAGDTEVLTDEHEEAAAWITRSTLPGGADQWSWWLASDSAIGVEKDVRHESTWKAARIGVRRAIERRRSDSSAQRSAEGGEA